MMIHSIMNRRIRFLYKLDDHAKFRICEREENDTINSAEVRYRFNLTIISTPFFEG